MNQTNLSNAAGVAVEKSKNIISQQIDRQVRTLGANVTQTARDLEQVGAQLRQSGMISGAAQLADWAAGYVDRAGSYLSTGDTESMIADLESFSRDRPWTVVASAAALGFAAARVVKSSSVRRYNAGSYVERFDGDYGFESGDVGSGTGSAYTSNGSATTPGTLGTSTTGAGMSGASMAGASATRATSATMPGASTVAGSTVVPSTFAVGDSPQRGTTSAPGPAAQADYVPDGGTINPTSTMGNVN